MNKFLVMSVLFAGICGTASAQEKENYYTEKWTDNIFIGANVGAEAVFNGGMNKPTFHFDVQLGKYITPVWGTRVEIGGMWQKLQADKGMVDPKQGDMKKTVIEGNLDGMLNITNLFGYDPARKVNFYAFAGPTMNVAKAVNATMTMNPNDGSKAYTYTTGGAKARIGASVGLGLGIDVTEALAIQFEARLGVTPSVFGEMSNCKKAEATGRGTIGITYTFGGKKFKKVSDRVIEKEVIREVPKEVIKEVIKEVKVESGKAVAAAAVFFKIGKSTLSDEGRVNIKLIAEAIKKSPAGTKYQVAGYADKATGSAPFNQKLSEKRAQVVYDALIAEGVSPSQLEITANGGVDPLFFSKDRLSRVTVIECK